ncbi:toll/interleukin-1 receptor domain-containing protein [Rhizorhapis sp.]|uniref:toll/interleukin-1 receptor domain-containing protein n=1 Tax=Rhizorhapis sp. TaxID=1968842 RepID=UPI002B475C75|nr:toll/interleukin-1 receptor domain-containing protein [Rhizorhapis sp.]HKR17058.1 toll/interleukin-1 receptor domain-containing protein [Rhizorhapis sp.]
MNETTSAEQEHIRAFISYSWSSLAHEAWVMRLASRLVEDGVDVILDKWNLKPGHDAHAFMEQMVTDQSVSKVMMICDKVYAEKANGRAGGVGAEAQILTPDLYAKAQQDKYATVVTEVDEAGKAFVPTFYGGRIYFDFSQVESEEASYEELLRWLLNKPRHVKPKLDTSKNRIIFALAGNESGVPRSVAA